MPAAVAVGVVGKPLGLRGEVHVLADPDLGEQFPPGAAYAAGARTLTVAASRLHGNRRVVRFEGISDRQAAETLRGSVLTVDRSQVALGDGAFWADELLGRVVAAADGRRIGTLAGVADGAAHDFLVVARPGGEDLLVPAVDELVAITAERIVVQPLPGLIDDDGADA